MRLLACNSLKETIASDPGAGLGLSGAMSLAEGLRIEGFLLIGATLRERERADIAAEALPLNTGCKIHKLGVHRGASQ